MILPREIHRAFLLVLVWTFIGVHTAAAGQTAFTGKANDCFRNVAYQTRAEVKQGQSGDAVRTPILVVVDRPPSLWQQNKRYVVTGTFALLAQMLVILAFLWQRSRNRRIEAELRESEERFRLVANRAPVMIWMSGLDKLCTYFNQSWLDFTGRPLGAELGNGWAEGVHSEDFARCLDTYTKAFDRHESFQMEYRLRRYDGEYCWVLDRGVPRFNADDSFAGYIGSAVDITYKKQAEEALSRVSQKLIEAHEEERTWIARELHDDINQQIALLAVNVGGLKQYIHPSAKKLGLEIGKTSKQLEELGNDVQALSHRLHSSKLEYLGLAEAAAGFCKELSERHDVEIDFRSANIPRGLPREISLCLFRVLQEALQNATKHSGSRHFQVSLSNGPHEIQLTVQDSGIGFDPEETRNGPGLGLTSMTERLKLVNGTLSIHSQPQRGTMICARVPLAPQAKSAAAGYSIQ